MFWFGKAGSNFHALISVNLTNVIDLGHRSRGYILKGSLGLPTMPVENYPETCLFSMYGLW